MEARRNAYRPLMRKPEGRRPVGEPRNRWVDKMDLGETGWGGVDWIGLAQDMVKGRTLVIVEVNVLVP
jgi:hypothetical protein